MTVKIIADSAADLPKELIEEYGIDVLPLMVYLGEHEFLDGKTIEPKELYGRMREGAVYRTAQVSLDTFRDAFSGYAERKESCIYLALSSELSGTFQSAVLARSQMLEDHPDFDLDIVDTKCASLGIGLAVIKAAQLAKQGKSKAEILETVRFYNRHMEHIFTVDQLEYLQRGGRVSRTAAIIGGLLSIKPVLDVEDGKLVPIEKVRGRRKVLERMLDLMEERGAGLQNQGIGISHGDDAETAETLKQLIAERFGCTRFVVSMVGAVIGAHSGPGTLALFFMNEV